MIATAQNSEITVLPSSSMHAKILAYKSSVTVTETLTLGVLLFLSFNVRALSGMCAKTANHQFADKILAAKIKNLAAPKSHQQGQNASFLRF